MTGDEGQGLRVSGLSCARGGVAVLEGVDLDLAAGRAIVLRGPNGIGKTTLLRTIAGLQPPLAGVISRGPDALAYAGHADGVKPMLTVAENLAFWAAVYGVRGIGRTLETMNLADLSHRPARNLSAGQKRRLGLARLLVTGRSCWLMDEPTVSLDAASVALFADVVAGHLAAGGTALIATHVDLGLQGADVVDLTPFRARTPVAGGGRDPFEGVSA